MVEFHWENKVDLLASYNKFVNEFEIGFDAETELNFSVEFSKGFKYDRLDGL